jgi:hypothetical protein
MFAVNSRYYGLAQQQLTLPDGQVVVYLERRFVPRADSLAALGSYVVRPLDRIDLIAYRALGDPELSWRIADGNNAMQPAELETPAGRRLRVTLPSDVPGGSGG